MPVFDEDPDGRCWSGGVPWLFGLGNVPKSYNNTFGRSVNNQKGTWRTSIAELVNKFKAPVVLVSAPEIGKAKCDGEPQYGVQVMAIAEKLPRNLKASIQFSCAYDFKGSATDRIASSRIRWGDGEGMLVKSISDFSLDYESMGSHVVSEDARSQMPTCPVKTRLAIENSFWFCTWWGQVTGAILQNFSMAKTVSCKAMPAIMSTSFMLSQPVRVVIVVSIDGGEISQVEKSWLPHILRGTLSNIRRRGYEWGNAAEIFWCHFPTIEDLLRSLNGETNLIHDWSRECSFNTDVYGRPMTFTSCAALSVQPHFRPSLLKGYRSADAVKTVMESCDLDAVSSFGQAAQAGDMDTLKYLLEKSSPGHLVSSRDPSDLWKMEPLHKAVSKGHVDVVRLLIDHRANMEATCFLGKPLHLAAVSAEDAGDACEMLLGSGATHNSDKAFPDYLQKPLHMAASVGNMAVARALISHGASPNCKTSMGRTPLHFAVLFGHPDMVQLLISKRADVDASDEQRVAMSFGMSAGAFLAWRFGQGHTTPLYRTVMPVPWLLPQTRIEEARILLAHGADPTRMNRSACCCFRCSPRGFVRKKILLLRCFFCCCRRPLREAQELGRMFDAARPQSSLPKE